MNRYSGARVPGAVRLARHATQRGPKAAPYRRPASSYGPHRIEFMRFIRLTEPHRQVIRYIRIASGIVVMAAERRTCKVLHIGVALAAHVEVEIAHRAIPTNFLARRVSLKI